MNERFRLVTEDWDDSYICDYDTHIPLDEVVEILNAQNDEIISQRDKIELLQKYIAIFKYDLKMKDLEISKLREMVDL